MSGATTPRSAGGQPKVMTSRLMNMKFMQRAVASSPLSTNTPTRTPDQHSTKRQKLSHGSATPTSTGTSTPIPNDSSPQFQRPEGGETEWVLHLPQPGTNGHTDAPDSSDEEDSLWHTSRSIGRQSYGPFKRRKTTLATMTTNNRDEDLSELESGEEEDMHPLRPMRRPRDREKEEEARGREMDRMNLKRMGAVSGSSSSKNGGGISKRKDGDGGKRRDKDGKKSKRGFDGKSGGGHGVTKRKMM